ncbi:BlaI/MecI/CopY family transcriptional regulator [Paenibacillus turicensis]|uniref:BlaI/MecI/CopY family transcriptional regulator n=1 Tax=Paenibacillus turicensis TaxID=160487 RepID=UPI003D289ECB
MTIELADSELKVMNLIWPVANECGITAIEVAKKASEQYGWKKNTTYTIINRLMKKEAIRKENPDFKCIPLITKDEVQQRELTGLVDKIFDGSHKLLFSTLLKKDILSEQELQELVEIIHDQKK